MDFVFANTHRMNKNFVLVISLLCSTNFLTAQTTDMVSPRGYATVIKQEPGELIYEFSIPSPDIDSVIGDDKALHSVALKHAESYLQADGYAVPSLNYWIELPVQANPTVRATAMNKKTLHGIRLSSARDDWSADSQADPTSGLRSSRNSSTSALASIRYHGKMRDIPLYKLNITPIQYNAQQHTLEITTRMQVVVRYNANTRTPVQEINNGDIDALLSDRLINAEPARRVRQLQTAASSTSIKLSKSSSSSSATAAITGGPYIRMTVDKEGIYKISVRELQDLSGVNLQSVDPRTLRLIGQGLEERVYVRSKKTDRLAADDIIEFYGEPYRAKHNKYLRDIPSKQGHYLDPWATDNVYFLIWGSSAGLRLIEEEGSLQERDPLSVIKPASYTTTKHFEE
ncbi:MAG TPA: C25 family peptidase propeptide domain-containing protein, partial [bacterium]|nr:C25 family peptidase propeptide domain-containing protein [bacterium]